MWPKAPLISHTLDGISNLYIFAMVLSHFTEIFEARIWNLLEVAVTRQNFLNRRYLLYDIYFMLDEDIDAYHKSLIPWHYIIDDFYFFWNFMTSHESNMPSSPFVRVQVFPWLSNGLTPKRKGRHGKHKKFTSRLLTCQMQIPCSILHCLEYRWDTCLSTMDLATR